MTGIWGDLTKKLSSSWWLPDNRRSTGAVLVVTQVRSWLSRALAPSSWSRHIVVKPSCTTTVESKRLSSAPESINARSSVDWPFQVRVMLSWVRGRGNKGQMAWLVRIFPPPDEPLATVQAVFAGCVESAFLWTKAKTVQLHRFCCR